MKNIIFIILCLQYGVLLPGQNPNDDLFLQKRSAEGVKLIDVHQGHKVWTQKVGDGEIKILLLPGGPGYSHEYFESFQESLNLKNIEFYYYDPLGTYYSDKPADTSLWKVERAVEEIEIVRKELDLEQFYLLGHSWGGVLAVFYAEKYSKNLKGLILSNALIDKPSYFEHYGKLREGVKEEVLAEFKDQNFQENDKVIQEAINTRFNQRYWCRVDPQPEPLERAEKHFMRTPLLNAAQNYEWKIKERIAKIKAPSLVIGSKYDIVPMNHFYLFHEGLENSTLFICKNGSHFPMWDSKDDYFGALKKFIKKVEAKRD